MIKEIFSIIKKNYGKYLTNDKLEFCSNISNDLFKIITLENKLPIYFHNDKFYINTYYDIDYFKYLIILCLCSLTSNLDCLKFGLILKESKLISDNYNLPLIDLSFFKEYEISSLIKEKILDDLGFNIIFKESNIEIFHYLSEEKGIKIAKLYYELIKKFNLKNTYDFNNFNLTSFLEYYNKINYQDIYDYIYDYISINIK